MLQKKNRKVSYKTILSGPWQIYDSLFKSNYPFSSDHNIYLYDANKESSFSSDEFDLLFNDQILNLKDIIFG